MGHYQKESKLFQALAHPVRLQILAALARQPSCVCELVGLIGRRQAYISQHLALLREVGLVSFERSGLNIFYQVNPTWLTEIMRLLHSFHPVELKKTIDIEFQGGYQMGKQINDNGQWHGIPRAAIQWQPTVVTERCVGCGLCATSCGREVYAFDYKQNRPVVVAPEMCMVGCTTCATICTQDAIEFPSTGYIRQVIRKNKLLRQSKNQLEANREKYDVDLRRVTAG